MIERSGLGMRAAALCLALAGTTVACGDEREPLPPGTESPAGSARNPSAWVQYARVNIDGLEPGERESLKTHRGVVRWLEVD